MDNSNSEIKIYFCGISKNCKNTIEKNLLFLQNFVENCKYKSELIFVDSDSVDGTKEILKNFCNKNFYSKYFDLDGLELETDNRIERILKSRNLCLDETLKTTSFNNIIYIPMDLDIDLFKYTNIEEFENLIEYCLDKSSINGIFPFSYPYYYDIFALRAKGWINYNSQFWTTRLKKFLKFGSFIFNYCLIFRHQKVYDQNIKENYKVTSAFGGIGIYKISNNIIKYKLSQEYPYDISEHIYFNSQFKNLEILTRWKIPAPAEHLEFKLLNLKQKFRYALKTFKNDVRL